MDFMNKKQLEELTGFKTKPAMVNALRSMGIQHRIRPDGMPLVHNGHIEKVFGATGESVKHGREPDYGAL